MSNKDTFAAALAGTIAGNVLSQPGGIRRTLGIIGLGVTVIVTAIVTVTVASSSSSSNSSMDAGTRIFAALLFTAHGVLWLPWVSAKASFPWTKFRWHLQITREIVELRDGYGMTILITMGASALGAIISVWMDARVFFAIAILLYVLSGLLWGFLTAATARRTLEESA